MPDALPMPPRAGGREAETTGLRLCAAMLEENGLGAALEVLMEALGGVSATVRRVPIFGPVADDRGVIASLRVQMAEELAMALWWNSAEGCATLGRLAGGGIVEHGRARRVPPALRRAVTLIVEVEQQGFCAITLWRHERSRMMTPRQTALLERLAPHAARAIGSELRRVGEALRAELLEGAGQGVMILDADHRVLSVSQGLRAMLADGTGLRLGERGLLAGQPGEQARLAGLIRAALRPDDGIPRDGRMCVARPGHAGPWQVEVRVLRPQGIAGVALIVSPSRLRQPPSEALLRETFSLTPAEASLAVSLADGMALAEHGRRKQITLPTVRSHLSRLLAKLNCHRQAEVVARLNALAG